MINDFRKVAQSWPIKILLVLMVISFVAWGVGDIIRGGDNNYAAKVAGQKISIEALQSQLSAEKTKLYRAYGSKINEEYFKTINLPFQVLYSMINDIVLKEEAYNLGLRVSNDYVANEIKKFPMFQDEQGNFSVAKFKQVLSHNHINEKKYLDNIKKEIGKEILLKVVLSGKVTLPNVQKIVSAIDNSTRFIDIYEFNLDNIKILTPTEKELKAIFDDIKYSLIIPEKRSFSYIKIAKQDLLQSIKLSNEEVNDEYDNRGYREYSKNIADLKPKIEEELKQKKSNAELNLMLEKIEDQIAAGSTMTDIAKSVGGKIEHLNEMSANSKPIEAISHELNKIFSYQKDQEPQIIYDQAKDTYFVVHLEQIIPQVFKSYDSSKVELKLAYKDKYIKDKLEEVRSNIAQKNFDFSSYIKEGVLKIHQNVEFNNNVSLSSKFPHQMLAEVTLKSKPGESTRVYKGISNFRYFAKLNSVKMVKASDIKVDEQALTNLSNDITQEIAEIYIQYLREKYKLKLNQAYLGKLLEND